MTMLKTKYAWLTAPILFFITLCLLTGFGLLASPEWIEARFDNDGLAPVEVTALVLFFAIIPAVWLFPPFKKGGWKALLMKIDFSVLALMAVCRELDWHKLMIHASGVVGETTGTPFKMRYLTNSINPLENRLIVLGVFILFFVVVGYTLLIWGLPRLWRGFWRLHPAAWTMAFFGGTTAIVLFVDRLPANWRHAHNGVDLPPRMLALLTSYEEGFEALMAGLALLAILQAFLIYGKSQDDSALDRYRD